jgi:hypothetical protein
MENTIIFSPFLEGLIFNRRNQIWRNYVNVDTLISNLSINFNDNEMSGRGCSLEAFGGEEGQADFLEQLVGRLTADQGVELRLLMWSWLTDLGEGDTTGLIRWD